MAFIRSLQLHAFRCYDSARLDGLTSGPVVLTGPNGAGKTNVLEAVSLLSPGRGIRGAKVAEMQQRDAGNPWAISAEADTRFGDVRIGTGLDANAAAEKAPAKAKAAKAPAKTAEKAPAKEKSEAPKKAPAKKAEKSTDEAPAKKARSKKDAE